MQKVSPLLTVGCAALLSGAVLSGCSNPTGSAGQMMYFTEGTITHVEVIDLKKNRYNTENTATVGAVGGAVAGQIIGGDTKGTLIGAGIGAIIGGLSAAVADRGEGLRLTVQTDQGLVLIDQPYSCMLQPGRKIRMINQDGAYQVQVLDNGVYKTAVAQSSSECNF